MQISELSTLLPADLDNHSRVWVYQGSRPFIEREADEINEQLLQFYTQWESHGAPVRGWARLLFRQFIVVIADETDVQVGGCSTDSSVRVIKSIERQYEVNFFDRMMLTFLVNGKAEMLPFDQVQYALDNGYINMNTPVFNNIVMTLSELREQWLVPLQKSWLAGRVSEKNGVHQQ